MSTAKLTALFPHLDLPLLAAPMAGVSGGLLASHVTQAGALGFIGAGHVPDPRAWVAHELAVARTELGVADEEQRLNIGVGFFVWKLDGMQPAEAKDLLRWTARRVKSIWLSFGERGRAAEWVRILKSSPEAEGCAVAVLVNTVQEVEDLVQKSEHAHVPDLLIVQSYEAGGHGSPEALPLVSLVPAVLSSLNSVDWTGRGHGGAQPLVIAAGGITTGAQLLSALALGADGVVCGTVFVASEESTYLPAQKDRIVQARGEQTVRTRVFDQMRSVPLPSSRRTNARDRRRANAEFLQRNDAVAAPRRWARDLQPDARGRRGRA
jgi:nitronate monooxygenase